MLTLEELAKKLEPIHNHICTLYDTKIVRLLGVAEDEVDLYYIVQEIGPKKEYRASAAGSILSLKNIHPRYKYLEAIFKYNNLFPTNSFIVESLPSQKYPSEAKPEKQLSSKQ